MTDTPDQIIDRATKTAEQVVHDARGVAEELVAKAESTAQKMVEQANVPPTNADLQHMFTEHANADQKVFRELRENQKGIDKRLAELPTKEQTEKLTNLLEALHVGGRVAIFGFNNSGKIVGFMILIGAVYMFFKLGFVAAFAWLSDKSPL